jgi:hypothetical protein
LAFCLSESSDEDVHQIVIAAKSDLRSDANEFPSTAAASLGGGDGGEKREVEK